MLLSVLTEKKINFLWKKCVIPESCMIMDRASPVLWKGSQSIKLVFIKFFYM